MESFVPKENSITLNEFIAVIVADIDIFLLQNADQNADLDVKFTVTEVRHQLENTLIKINSLLKNFLVDDSLPIFTAMHLLQVALSSTISDKEFIRIRHRLVNNYLNRTFKN